MEGGGSFLRPHIAAGISGVACLILSAHSAGAVESGVFCIRAGSISSSGRNQTEPDVRCPGMRRAMSSRSTALRRRTRVAGVKVKSDSDPQQRCTLNFVNCLLSGSREIQDKSLGLRLC